MKNTKFINADKETETTRVENTKSKPAKTTDGESVVTEKSKEKKKPKKIETDDLDDDEESNEDDLDEEISTFLGRLILEKLQKMKAPRKTKP